MMGRMGWRVGFGGAAYCDMEIGVGVEMLDVVVKGTLVKFSLRWFVSQVAVVACVVLREGAAKVILSVV
jgi:hypothetical protein